MGAGAGAGKEPENKFLRIRSPPPGLDLVPRHSSFCSLYKALTGPAFGHLKGNTRQVGSHMELWDRQGKDVPVSTGAQISARTMNREDGLTLGLLGSERHCAALLKRQLVLFKRDSQRRRSAGQKAHCRHHTRATKEEHRTGRKRPQGGGPCSSLVLPIVLYIYLLPRLTAPKKHAAQLGSGESVRPREREPIARRLLDPTRAPRDTLRRLLRPELPTGPQDLAQQPSGRSCLCIVFTVCENIPSMDDGPHQSVQSGPHSIFTSSIPYAWGSSSNAFLQSVTVSAHIRNGCAS